VDFDCVAEPHYIFAAPAPGEHKDRGRAVKLSKSEPHRNTAPVTAHLSNGSKEIKVKELVNGVGYQK
jgi:hypothetical protein